MDSDIGGNRFLNEGPDLASGAVVHQIMIATFELCRAAIPLRAKASEALPSSLQRIHFHDRDTGRAAHAADNRGGGSAIGRQRPDDR